MHIRDADPDRDGDACAAIYARSVTVTAASFEERAPTASEMAARIARVTERWPWLVAELDGAVVGYAYAAQHRDRAAYRWAVDITVYIDPGHHRRGVGRALYEPLLALVTQQGYYTAIAGITLPNPGSVGLHEALGFERVGVYRAIGYKAGAWRDVGWWQKLLQAPADDGQPPEPGPPARLADPAA
jgi:phosphinothricin acetyltransferase